MKTKTKTTTTNNWIDDLEFVMKTETFGTYTGVHRIAIHSETSGTGKSNAAENAARELFASSSLYEQQRDDGLAPVVVTLFADQDVSEIVGPMLLTNGETRCVAQFAAHALKFGLPLIIHEFDQYSPGVETMLNSILDDLRIARVALADGQTITAAPGFCVVGTTNARPDELPERLLNRFDVLLHATTISPGIVGAVGAAWGEILQAQQQRRNERVFFAPVNPRRAIAAQKLISAGVDRTTALRLTFGNNPEQIAALETALAVAGEESNANAKRERAANN